MEFAPRHDFLTMNHAHQLHAHANDRKIINTSKCVLGLNINNSESVSTNCESCVISKSRNRTSNHSLCKEQTPDRSYFTLIST